MQLVKHRVNSPDDLETLDPSIGAEIDIRYHNDQLILDHDPLNHHMNENLLFAEFLEHWRNDGLLIVNLKSEGIELACLDLLKKYNVRQWFFLDMSMPYFVKFALHAEMRCVPQFGPRNLCVRFSEYEPIEYALSFKNKVEWVWVDFFNHLPLDELALKKLRDANFKICLVSPELQGHSSQVIEDLKRDVINYNVDAVCTKFPEMWS